MAGRALHVVLALLVLGSTVGFGLATADSSSGFSVEATTSIDAPDRTISVQGNDYQITSLGKIDQGETLRVEVSLPSDQIFTVHLYNTDRMREDLLRRSGNGTYSLDTDSLDPSTYILALDVDGVIRTIQPVVVSGHEFDVDAPDTVSRGEPISVTASVSDDPRQVDVVVFNETWERTATAAGIGGDDYNAVIDEDLAPGEYTLYVGTRGSDTYDGERVLNGVSSTYEVEVEGDANPTTSEPTTTAPPGDSTTTRDGTSSTTEPATNRTTVTTRPTTPATTVTSATPSTTVASTPGTTANSSTGPATTSSANETTRSVITPNTPSQDTTTDTATPGFTAITAFVAVLALAWRRR
jgi:hypothetical protein